MLEQAICPVCRSVDCCPISVRKAFGLTRCQNCGLVFRCPMPNPDEVAALYADGYHAVWHDCETAAAVRRMKRLTGDYYLGLIKRHRSSGVLLDIGCAHGAMLDSARDSGFEVCGVELAPEALREARRRGHRVFDQPLEALDLGERRFDVISLIDVVEHLPSPTDYFRRLNRLISPGGIVLVVTPNVGSWVAKVMGAKWPHYEKEHLCYYQPSSITCLLQESGFVKPSFTVGRKYLTVSYVQTHYARFLVGRVSRFLSCVVQSLPKRLSNWPQKVLTEFVAIAQKQ